MDKTIKELAEQFGVSKQAVRKRINQLPTSWYYIGTNRTIYIKPQGIEKLEEMLSTKASTKAPTVDTNLVDTLIHQLEEKDRQIDRLQTELENAQKLHALAEQKLQLLEVKDEPKKRKCFFRS